MRTKEEYCYITTLSSFDYLPGVLVLAESLRNVKSQYNLVVVLIGVEKDKNRIVAALDHNRISHIEFNAALSIPNEVISTNIRQGKERWNKTFQKLFMFNMTEYKKMVYMDCDMIVLKNIDHLFSKPHLSAVVDAASYPGNEHRVNFNSGIIIIEPEECLAEKIFDVISNESLKNKAIGDQDLLQLYYSNWRESKELHLDEGYNLFFDYVDYYVRKLGYKIDKNIYVVHFCREEKPWNPIKYELVSALFRHLLKLETSQLRIYLKYRAILKRVYR